MENLKKLLEKLHVPADMIAAFSADALPDNADDLIASYHKSRLDFLKSSPEFKSELKSKSDAEYKATVKKVFKKINTELGLELTNAEIDNLDDGIPAFAEVIKAANKSSSGSADHDKVVSELKTKVSELRQKVDSLTEEKDAIKAEADTRVQDVEENLYARQYYSKMLAEDAELQSLDVPGKSFVLETIEKNIFDSVKVTRDGKVLAKDGGKFLHPEKEVVVDDVKTLFGFYKEKAHLVKRSNAGKGPDLVTNVEGIPADKVGEIEQQMANLRAGRQ